MKPLFTTILTLLAVACGEEQATQAVRVGETGKATAELQSQRILDELREGLSRSSQGMTVEERSDGIKKVSLRKRFRSVSVVTTDGRATCLDSPEQLDRLVGVKP
jgi:hypothetical protein